MQALDDHWIAFLLRAKKSTYAAGDAGQVASSRPQSHDLVYTEGEYRYLDTYLGGFAFAGQEAVWWTEAPFWAMNYYGTMTIDTIPDGFGDFLKQSLRHVPAEAPYRGPAEFADGPFRYHCQWEGTPERFRGTETISLDGQVIYALDFHGGRIR